MRPLEGITVVALEHAVAAPLASRHLADLGARVIKVERPGGGDFARSYDQSVRGQASYFLWLNHGKESLTLDLKQPAAREVLARLLGRADVLVQNLAPGASARLGLGYPELAPQHPRLVVCDISGYGESGPYAAKKAYDMLIQAEAGVIGITGTPAEPARVGVPIADIATGMYALSGCVAALFRRERNGIGGEVKVAMLDALSEWMGFALYMGAYGGAGPARDATSHPAIAPYGAHRTANGTVIFGLQNEREWQKFCAEVLHDAALAEDPRFATNVARVRNRAALTQRIEAVLERLPTIEAVRLLDQAGIANGRVNSVREVWEHPQFAARNRWGEVATEVGAVRTLLPPFQFADVPPVLGRVPALGEHTGAILRELGYDEAACARLSAAHAV